MGANLNTILPHAARVADVAKIIGKLAGVGTRVRIVPCENMPQLVTIHLDAPGGTTFVDGEAEHFCYYHFEYAPGRLLSPKDTGWWVTLSKGLIDFYGGKVLHDVNDEVVYSKPNKRVSQINGDGLDGKAWHRFQKRIEDIQPFTVADWQSNIELSEYKF